MSEADTPEEVIEDDIFYLGALYILDEMDCEDSVVHSLPKVFDFTRVYLNDNPLSKKGIRSKQLDELVDDKSLLCNRSLASLEVLAPGSSLSSNDSNADLLSAVEDDDVLEEPCDVPPGVGIDSAVCEYQCSGDGADFHEETGGGGGNNVIINLADLRVSDVSTLNRKIHSEEIEGGEDIAANIASRSMAFVLKNFHLPEPTSSSDKECDRSPRELSPVQGDEILSFDSSDLVDNSDDEDLQEDLKGLNEDEEENEEAAAMRALGFPTAFGKDADLYDPAAQDRPMGRKKAKRKKSKSKSILQREISCVQNHSHVVDKIFNDLWQNWKGGWLIEDQMNFYNILKEKLSQFLVKRAEKQKEKKLEALECKEGDKHLLRMDPASDCDRFFALMGFVSDFNSVSYQSPDSACYHVFPKTLSSTKNLGLLMLPLHQPDQTAALEMKLNDSLPAPTSSEKEPAAQKRDLDTPFTFHDSSSKRSHTSDGVEIGYTNSFDAFDPRLDEDVKKYWPQRYRFFHLFDEGIRLDKESWFSVTPQVIAEHHASRCRCDIIIDAFCGAGGNTIRFAQTCQLVIAVDIDPVKLSMAQHNAKIYGVEDRCLFILGDFFQLAKLWRFKADIVFLSPPWGGPEYLNQTTMNQPRLEEILNTAFSISSDVVYHAPRNINIAQLLGASRHGQRCQIEQNIVNYKLKVITVYWGDLLTKQQADHSLLSESVNTDE